MFYKVTDKICEVPLKELDQNAIGIGILSMEEFRDLWADFGFSDSTLESCENPSRSLQNTVQVYDDYTFGLLQVIQDSDILGERDRIAFFIKKNLFLIVDIRDVDQSTIGALTAALEHPAFVRRPTLEKVVYAFLSRLISGDIATLERLESSVEELDRRVTDGDTNGFDRDLALLRRKLLILRGYYEHLVSVGEDLAANENGLFTGESLRYLKLFTDRAARLSGNVQMQREAAAQLREAYQARMDYNLNSIMKLFTVVTTVFLPLTLITSWYGMNFVHMPELRWPFAYPAVLILCIGIVTGCLLWFKKKKLL